MKIKHYLITAVISYFIFLIYMTPAAPVINFLIKDNKNISISSVNGSLWNGSAQSVRINRHEINDIQWSFISWHLLIGKISFDVEAVYKNEAITTTIALSLTNKLLIHDLSTTLSARVVGDIFDMPIGELGGEINIQIDDATWSTSSVPIITGEIQWNNAAVIVVEKTELGNVTIVFSENDITPLNAIIENVPGHLAVDGSLSVDDSGYYKLEITLKPTNNASNNLRNSLKFMAKPQSDGSFKINNTGELSTLGLM